MPNSLILILTFALGLSMTACTKKRELTQRDGSAPTNELQSPPRQEQANDPASDLPTPAPSNSTNHAELIDSQEVSDWKFSETYSSGSPTPTGTSSENKPSNTKIDLTDSVQDKKNLTHRIWMEDSRLIVSDDHLTDKGLSFKYQIQGNPLLVTTDEKGNSKFQGILSGKFNVTAKIIHVDFQNDKEDRKVLAVKTIHDTKIDKKSISAKIEFLLENTPKSGQIYLGLILEPISLPFASTNFQGLYSLGNYKNLTNGTWLKIHPYAREKNFSLAQFASKIASSSASNNSQIEKNYQSAKVHLEHFKFDFPQKGIESTFKKEFIYRMIICPINGVDQDHFVARDFDYQIDNGEVLKGTTDNTGCFYPVASHEIPLYGCQKFISKNIRIKNADLGMNETQEYFINPWKKEAMDARDVNDKNKLTLTCPKNSPTQSSIFVDRYSFTHESFDYQVQKDLNLVAKKTGTFQMDVRVNMLTDLESSFMAPQPLRSGIYFLRTLITRNVGYDSKNTYITHAEKPVSINGGVLSQVHLEFLTPDHKALGNNNTIFVQLIPLKANSVNLDQNGIPSFKPEIQNWKDAVDSEANLISPVFAGNITLNNRVSSMALNAVNSDYFTPYMMGEKPATGNPTDLITTVIQLGLKKREEQLSQNQALMKPENYAHAVGLKYVNLSKLDHSEELRKILGMLDTDTLFADLPDSISEYKQALKTEVAINRQNLRSSLDAKKLSSRTMTALCYYFGNNLIASSLKTEAHGKWVKDCVSMIKENGFNTFISEKRIFVNGVNEKAKWYSSSPFNITVGNSLSASFSESDSISSTANVTAKVDVSKKFMDLLSIGAGSMVSLSRSYSKSRTSSDSVSIGEGVSLFVNPSILGIDYQSSESCTIVKMNSSAYTQKPNKWIFLKQKNLSKHLKSNISENEIRSVLTSGLLFCEGIESKKPGTKVETYYTISQVVGSDENPEAQADKSRPFFTVLRGENDYKRFSETLKANMKEYEAGITSAHLEQGLNQSLLEWLSVLYQSAPSAPGQFTEKP